jgi:von Willebrand factor type A C-terminal domain/von Willebrand factor type A domain
MSQPDFTVDIYQNEYLPEDGRDVSAVITVTTAGTAGAAAEAPAAEPDSAEIIIIDCSGSMMSPRSKITQARAATAAAVDVIRDGVAFAVIAGTHQAVAIFPGDGTLAIAGPQTREEAKQAVARLQPGGGTAIGQWLWLAQRMFSSHPAQLRHAILLTDGKDEHETSADLDTAISQCEGVFSCDCRGVGTDWKVDELRRISTALLGTVDIVADPSGLAADFSAMMAASMAKQVADVSLRIWTPQHATIQFVKQVAPDVEDLTGRRAELSPQAGDYPTGAWGNGESRDYHLGVEVAAAGGVGQEMLAARVSLVTASPSGPETLGQGLVKAIWTDDEALSTRINNHVAHYTGQAELAEVIQEGLEARKQGDEDAAAAKLGRAVALAHESGNEDTAKLLAKVVDVVDAATGTVRLKKKVDDADEMALDTRSTKTVRTRK